MSYRVIEYWNINCFENNYMNIIDPIPKDMLYSRGRNVTMV